ncbi:hypothetical protein MMC34_000388 [Xylographa carneopallida]|nr:hypothetical protein [Xylographa carneopallida]
MATAEQVFIDLEHRRKQLEDALAHLRKSLQHWQTWEAEYEGLKEEILGLGNDPSVPDIKNLGVDFGGDLLTELEIKELLEDAKGQQRSAGQILGLLSRRVDYVQNNVRTLIQQVNAAEDKLEAMSAVIYPVERSEDGLPLTEITEELDEDGNVISSSISTPGESSKKVVEALRKAGVKDLPIPQPPEIVEPSSPEEGSLHGSSRPPVATYEPKNSKTFAKAKKKRDADSTESIPKAVEASKSQRKKAVSFSQDTKAELSKSPISSPLTTTKEPLNAHDEILARDTIPLTAEIVPGIHNRNETHEDVGNTPIESPKDAALRRQMLQYSMNEVGAIVAEMDLEDSDSMTDYSEEAEDDLGSETDEEEDQYGRTTRRVISDDYRKQMLELEQKLNAQMQENVRPNLDIPALEAVSHGIVSVNGNSQPQNPKSIEQSTPKPKKGVRFAESLDISEVSPRPASSQRPTTIPSASTPIADLIVERGPSNIAKLSTSSTKQRPSKFKTTQQVQIPVPHNQANSANISASSSHHPTRHTPTGPRGLTHATTLIERPPSTSTSTSTSSATRPDEHDPALMQQSLAIEYHRVRNRMIHRSGGFVPHDEDDEPASIPLVDSSQAPGKRVSLFKRARLG